MEVPQIKWEYIFFNRFTNRNINYCSVVSQNKIPMNMVTNQPQLMYFTTYITINKMKIINIMGFLTIAQTN